jgi:ribosomal protein S27E
MDRKYKQRGYMESGSEPVRREKRAPKERGMKVYGMRNGGTARSGIRCARCGKTIVTFSDVAIDSVCESCGSDLHTCTNCSFFSTSARYECSKPIAERIAPKDGKNECPFFSPAVFVERTFESESVTPQDARRAFDALFKKG